MNYRTNRPRIAVIIEIEPQRFLPAGEAGKRPEKYAVMRALVERGLRAQMQTGSLLTGKQLIALDIHPDQPNRKLIMSGKHPKIPTIPSTINAISDSATRILAKFEKLPLDALANDLRTAVRSADGTLKEAKRFIGSIEGEAAPLLKSLHEDAVAAKLTIVQAKKTLATIDNLASENSDVRQQLAALLQELTDASRSIKQLAEYLELHPEALVRGKSGVAR